jgi:hypothetical protein
MPQNEIINSPAVVDDEWEHQICGRGPEQSSMLLYV